MATEAVTIATIPYGTRQKFNRCSTLDGKKNILVSGYSTTGVHGKKKIKKKISLILKKFVCDYSTTMVHGTWEKCNNSRLSPKK